MAGGEGTRLRPLTSLRPKPMVPIFNQPIMQHILGLVKHHGITDAVATLAFMPQVIEDYFGDGDELGVRLSYALEETPLGTAGSVKNAMPLLADDTFVVISGDALTDIDLTEVIAFHKKRKAHVTIALKRVPDPLEFGVVITDEEGRIERFLEKPSWGQVFSDTINTGIYVLEPEIFEHVPDKKPFDFSSELFPLLMEKGYNLYGCVVDGYWCDVGSFESYMTAHREVLDGEAMIHIPGVQAHERVWVGDGAEIDPDATIVGPAVIGANVTIRAGAHIGEYVVLGDNCVIGNDASVTHSVIWSDTFVGKNSTVNGAALCRRVDVRAGARIDAGAVIGDESMIGHGAQIGTGVQIYAYKRVEPAAVVNESIIWENVGSRSLFGDYGIAGLVGVDITPELALKAAQAFGSMLPKGSHTIVSRDSSRAGRMVKRAMVAGLNSSGCNVRDLRVASSAINRFTTRDTRCTGGVHVCQSSRDRQSLEIHFYDKTGLDIAPWEEKKLERSFFRGEFRRAFLAEIGDIIYPPRAIEYYSAGLSHALERRLNEGRWLKVVADLNFGVASLVLPQVSTAWRLDLISLHPFLDAERTVVSEEWAGSFIDELRHTIDMFQADVGVRFDALGERITFITPSGRVLDGEVALLAMTDLWCRTDRSGLPVAVPLTATWAVESVAERSGHTVLRPGRSGRALAAATLAGAVGFAGNTSGGYMFADFLAAFDSVMSLGMLCCMLAEVGESLDDVVDGLPDFHKRQASVFCPVHRKGAVMRSVTKASAQHTVDLTEGVRVTFDDGWVLVLPHSSDPSVTLYAEGSDSERADGLLSEWRAIVEAAVADGESTAR